MKNKLCRLSKKLGQLLRKKKLTLACAESCSGGLLSSVITDIVGSSDYFVLGVVTYSKIQKEKLLKISKVILRKYSPVSTEVAICMAKHIMRIAKTDIGVGITGFAGPTGGTPKNPKGTVYIAVAVKDRVLAKRHLFKGGRIQVKRKAVEKALRLVCELASSTS
ncbi:MAG: CinA family protein [Candidatus Omnitrophica bacterium]|nr:CinA family protein [Candidatus Omnitrophota bacterium]